LADLMASLATCMQCGACVGTCPVTGLNGFHVRRLAKKLYMGWVGRDLLKDDAWTCLLCARCVENCPKGIDLPEAMVELRRMAVAKGVLPAPVKLMKDNLEKYGNPVGVDPRRLAPWAKGEVNLPSSGKRLFYAGFYLIADHVESMVRSALRIPIGTERIAAAAAALQRVGLGGLTRAAMGKVGEAHRATLKHCLQLLPQLGIEASFLYEGEPWVGTELHTYGFLDEFADHAKRVYSSLKERGIEEIITPDPISAATFKVLYPKFVDGFSMEVRTFIELIAERLESKPIELKGRVEARAVFHDPCMLARYLKVEEEPRLVLSRIPGLDLAEPPRNRRYTVCCGAGGLEAVKPRLAREVAVKSLENLTRPNPNLIATACPICTLMLRLGAEKVSSALEVLDVADLLWKAVSGGQPC